MGHSTNIVSLRAGVTFNWKFFFVSSHFINYFYDFNLTFNLLYKYLYYLFKFKYYQLLFDYGMFFAYIRIKNTSIQSAHVRLYVYDLKYLREYFNFVRKDLGYVLKPGKLFGKNLKKYKKKMKRMFNEQDRLNRIGVRHDFYDVRVIKEFTRYLRKVNRLYFSKRATLLKVVETIRKDYLKRLASNPYYDRRKRVDPQLEELRKFEYKNIVNSDFVGSKVDSIDNSGVFIEKLYKRYLNSRGDSLRKVRLLIIKHALKLSKPYTTKLFDYTSRNIVSKLISSLFSSSDLLSYGYSSKMVPSVLSRTVYLYKNRDIDNKFTFQSKRRFNNFLYYIYYMRKLRVFSRYLNLISDRIKFRLLCVRNNSKIELSSFNKFCLVRLRYLIRLYIKKLRFYFKNSRKLYLLKNLHRVRFFYFFNRRIKKSKYKYFRYLRRKLRSKFFLLGEISRTDRFSHLSFLKRSIRNYARVLFMKGVSRRLNRPVAKFFLDSKSSRVDKKSFSNVTKNNDGRGKSVSLDPFNALNALLSSTMPKKVSYKSKNNKMSSLKFFLSIWSINKEPFQFNIINSRKKISSIDYFKSVITQRLFHQFPLFLFIYHKNSLRFNYRFFFFLVYLVYKMFISFKYRAFREVFAQRGNIPSKMFLFYRLFRRRVRSSFKLGGVENISFSMLAVAFISSLFKVYYDKERRCLGSRGFDIEIYEFFYTIFLSYIVYKYLRKMLYKRVASFYSLFNDFFTKKILLFIKQFGYVGYGMNIPSVYLYPLAPSSFSLSLIFLLWTWKLKRKFTLNQTVWPFIKQIEREFKYRNKFLIGLSLKASGRFTRRQRAIIKKYVYGRLSYSTLTRKLVYGYSRIITRYGSCGLKLWCRIAVHRIIRYRSNFNFNVSRCMFLRQRVFS